MNNTWSRKLAAMLLAGMMLLCSVSALAETTEETAAEAAAETTEETTAAETAEEAAEAAVAEEKAAPVLLATVNGEEIWSDNKDLTELTQYYLDYYAAYGYDTTEESFQTYLKLAGLQWAVESTLYHQKAEELGVSGMTEEQRSQIEADAKAEWDQAISYYAEQQGKTDTSTEEEAAAATVAALAYVEANFGYTEESYINEYVESSLETMLRENVQKAVLGDTTVTDEAVTDYFNELVEEDRSNYENNVPMYEYYTNYMGSESYYVPEGYRGITHILLEVDADLMSNYTKLAAELEEQQEQETADESTDAAKTEETAAPAEETTEAPAEAETTEEPKEPVTQEMVDAARQAILDSVADQVKEIMAKYEAGTPFADLIAEYGTDPGMTTEPNKTNGYAVHKDSILWDPAFTEGAMSLNAVGDVSEPVLGSYGIHILHYTRDIPAGAVELTEELRGKLREELQEEQDSAAVSAMVEEWREKADIQYTAEGQEILDAASAMTDEESVEATEATEEALADGN